ncbi:hypothetical protein L1987_30368 [Smallanthus sonchifolius]|uniref:Uncharacterized protein n=1 Tax=Smallanthus sonchifolius TaxID=185202 RepID=A0ACB9I201_9ASTR|nr:hypothetical protein L1987_30368 [Smallanthus sonchifolius]
MKKLRCRLNLLKNKRCCIVDQIYKDECIIAVYDLLAHFCEFLSLQLSYIRHSKDCPNDINEAISSLIFASARCGELPELLRIRKLFSQRYGEIFESRALDLLPGNLVNFQIREYLSMNEVPNQLKSKLVKEITTTVLQTRPLALEFTSEQRNGPTNGTGNDQIANADFSPSQSDFDHPAAYHQHRLITYHVEAESSSEIIYQDDIEEFQSPLKDGENEKDQRVFMFTSTAGAGNHKIINFLITIIEILEDSMKVKRQSRKRSGVYIQQTLMLPPGHESRMLVKPIGEPARAMSMPCNLRKKCLEEDGVIPCLVGFYGPTRWTTRLTEL